MNTDEQFFYDHAGYGWNPVTETEDQGRVNNARALANAERTARERWWVVYWEDDWSIGCTHRKFYGEAYDEPYPADPETCERVTLVEIGDNDDDNGVLASIGCVDDATDDYRRVLAAELASEAIENGF